jgi:hypothetical protein
MQCRTNGVWSRSARQRDRNCGNFVVALLIKLLVAVVAPGRADRQQPLGPSESWLAGDLPNTAIGAYLT